MAGRLPALGNRIATFSLLALALVLGSSQASPAATLFMTSSADFSSRNVGDRIDLSFAIRLGAGEGPGTLDITLDWGSDRALYAPYQLGALVLLEAPSASTLNPLLSVHLSDDCGQGVNAPSGACTLRASSAQPLAAGLYDLTTLKLRYDWLLAPGYERCVVQESDPSCVPAVQQVTVSGLGTDFAGDPIIGVAASTSTLATPGVRPIPEPSAATAIALGLALLARRSRVAQSTDRRS
ncbi:hypothetical protein K2X89_10875 [Myxococcota bacterium]|nr:hypothetical protein [Myxococcota bacterium]